MRKMLAAIALGMLAIAPQATFADSREASRVTAAETARYDAAIAQLRAGNLDDIDMRWMRLERAKRNGYYFSDWEEKDRSRVYDLLNQGKTQEARTLVEARLKKDFLDPRAHVAGYVVAEKLGQTAESALHIKINNALIASIKRGKSGRSAEDSWEAAYVGEEYFMLWVDRYEFKAQRLANVNGHVFDVIHCLDEDTQKEVDIWFEIDSFFGKGMGID